MGIAIYESIHFFAADVSPDLFGRRLEEIKRGGAVPDAADGARRTFLYAMQEVSLWL